MTARPRLHQLVAALLLASLFFASTAKARPFTLDAIHEDLKSRYAPVNHMSPAQLQAAQATDNRKLLILDAREKNEYAVSHIVGAKRVDPGIWHNVFMSKFGKQAKDKTVIIYCSVGERSSKLAQYVGAALRQNGATGVYNLQGGIFKWHNDKRPLIQTNHKTTDHVHPYDKHWGRLVQRNKLLRMSPK